MTSTSSLAVWAAQTKAGLLAQEKGGREYVFAYSPDVAADAQASLTMPTRLASWTSPYLHPVFQMNLPEGALLEAIRRAIAKIIGEDDLSILRVTGGNQVGRNRFSLPADDRPAISESPESLNELLAYADTRDLFHELVRKYALQSGVSGIQPKVLLNAAERGTITSAGYIVKSWGTDFPQLAANEYFCMTAAKRAGLSVPEFFLSDNGGLFIIRRFDIAPEGTPLGFEDMCSLQALGTLQKYRSSYERIAKSINSFVSGENLIAAREQFFATLALSLMVRNGDAHLKNFGALYSSPSGLVSLAPVYDVVTTTVYVAKDVPALSLAGTKKWWSKKILERFGVTHLSIPVATISGIFQRVAQSVTETREMIHTHISERPEFKDIGQSMMTQWNEGIRTFFE